ncbi:hypothetical protein EYF80_016839 [Liparis tanakae]|uniref:Uncharacterized protein n=1 Tax=Liparis tanakae TaxID=230148 RepID=A0A4Z2I505_9TELE|nr:hypothetical protein EYF80_016839 [Liparis tanakae]
MSVPSLASPCGLAEAEMLSAAQGGAELWEPGREVLLLGPWAWLVLVVLVVLVVVGGFSSLSCLDLMGDWPSLSVAVPGGLSSAPATALSFGGLALPEAWDAGLLASTWVSVCTDSADAPDDLSRRRSSLDACSSSRMGDSSVSAKTSSEREASTPRGAALPPPPPSAPGSFRRCSGSFWEGCLSVGNGSRLHLLQGTHDAVLLAPMGLDQWVHPFAANLTGLTMPPVMYLQLILRNFSVRASSSSEVDDTPLEWRKAENTGGYAAVTLLPQMYEHEKGLGRTKRTRLPTQMTGEHVRQRAGSCQIIKQQDRQPESRPAPHACTCTCTGTVIQTASQPSMPARCVTFCCQGQQAEREHEDTSELPYLAFSSRSPC